MHNQATSPQKKNETPVTEKPQTPTLNRRSFITSSTASLAALSALTAPASFAARPDSTPEVQSLLLPTGRKMAYRVLGAGEHKAILVHGFPGSSRQFLTFDKFLREHHICALAPNLYGSETDWSLRKNVTDTGNDIAQLSQLVHGQGTRPIILGVSGGAKDAIATTIALNTSRDGDKVPALYVISAQMDLSNRDVFKLCTEKKQRDLRAIYGAEHGKRVEHIVARGKLRRLSEDPELAYQEIVGKMSKSEDLPILDQFPDFKQQILDDVAGYSPKEIIHSVRRLFRWKLDLEGLQGTQVHIIHGTEDPMVPAGNADILQQELTKVGLQASFKTYPDGHLLLKKRAEEIGLRILEDFRPQVAKQILTDVQVAN